MDSAHLAGMFARSVVKFADEPAVRISDGEGWQVTTYAELGEKARKLAARLIDRGLAPGDRVALFSANRPEWTLVDLACAYAALVSVPLYATSAPEQLRHIVADSGARLIFVAGAREADIVAQVRDALPELEAVITLLPTPEAITLDDELAAAPEDTSAVDLRVAAASPDDLATVIYQLGEAALDFLALDLQRRGQHAVLLSEALQQHL